MWTAKVNSTNIIDGRLHITVELKNGDRKFDEVITVNNAQPDGWLDSRIRERIAVLDSLEAYATKISDDSFKLDLAEPVVAAPTPSPEQETISQFINSVVAAKKLDAAVELGAIEPDDEKVIAAKNEVKQAIQTNPELVELLEA